MEYISIVMVRENLDRIPQYPLPSGFRMRMYRENDHRTWLKIQQMSERFAEVTASTFDRDLGKDPAAIYRRCFFLISPDGRDIGTITAWYDRSYGGRRWGRIHYVAIIPQYRGIGLSRCMMTTAMGRLRTLGHRRAMLVTQTPRIAAIRTYLRFGFVPDASADNAKRGWRIVRRHISHPALRRP